MTLWTREEETELDWMEIRVSKLYLGTQYGVAERGKNRYDSKVSGLSQ